ncbi:hypothetical protein A8B79_04330 [Balneola sp. EhC07]|uniref:hypothetical protein n=1 Tax=Balneola sp. EhC07 TaxID=1849360 RepID=UPI0007F47DFF|nr:hypothetical protein [Balneola sp. EhC07]OAN61660.1 hypothetical protein A8B79_04330 [Balneola sp. EhC07]
MKLIRIQIWVMSGVFLLFPMTVLGQTSFESVELEAKRAIRQLILKVNTIENNSELKDELLLLSSATNNLFEKIDSDDTISESEDEFINSLVQAKNTLANLPESWRSNNHAILTMQFIRKDFAIKATSSPLSNGSMIRTKVRVSVMTKKNGALVPGYDAKCNYMWDANLLSAKIVFTNQTNDAVKNLAPGYYIFWIEKDGEIVQKREMVEIGNLQTPEESVIFNL